MYKTRTLRKKGRNCKLRAASPQPPARPLPDSATLVLDCAARVTWSDSGTLRGGIPDAGPHVSPAETLAQATVPGERRGVIGLAMNLLFLPSALSSFSL